MQNVILVIHILACLVMIGLVLVQKSEGGGLGIGGGGGGNSLLSGRGAAGAVVRSTIIFGAIFFVTSLALTTISNRTKQDRSDIERALTPDDAAPSSNGPADLFDPSAPLLSGQGGLADDSAAAPADETPAPVPDTGAEADTAGSDDAGTAEPETESPAPDESNPQ